jgi:hypothetical protein
VIDIKERQLQLKMKVGRASKSNAGVTRKESDHNKLFHYYWAQGVCWSCGREVNRDLLERGHLIDRVCGGNDNSNNIRPMCWRCNHILKPFCKSIEEANQWRRYVRNGLMDKIDSEMQSYFIGVFAKLKVSEQDKLKVCINCFFNKELLLSDELKKWESEFMTRHLDRFYLEIKIKYGNPDLF